eukprot:TRINITY_DN15412_c0_g1_i1.p1 TRINITY_DN15412_c0_g1~~TRINITY_DN15412_c0_g1_i1.p1  ORF type:complete len:431 (+),score=85.48 TRINITY_DN15412_c0_g1_i1:114-1406(+)
MALSLLYTTALSFSWSCEDNAMLIDDFGIKYSATDLVGCQELCREHLCKTLTFSDNNECLLTHRAVHDTVKKEGSVTCGFVEHDTEEQERSYELLEVVPLDGSVATPAPDTLPPVPPTDGVDPDGIPYCKTNTECQFNGDMEATCDVETGRCICGDGYENKVINKRKQYSCRPLVETGTPKKLFIILKLVFKFGNCAEFKARGFWRKLIVIITSRFRGAIPSSNSTGCASIHFNAEMEVEQNDVTDVLPSINADVQQEIEKDADLSGVVGNTLSTSAEVVPLGAGTPCQLTGSSKTTQFEINGAQVCSALQCTDGYQLVDGETGITECRVATINTPTTLTRCTTNAECVSDNCVNGLCSLQTRSSDDEATTTIIIVSVIGTVLFLILLALCIYFLKRSSSQHSSNRSRHHDAASSEISYNYSDSYNDIVV